MFPGGSTVDHLLPACRDLLKPADEVAEDVLETFDDIEADEVLESPLSPDEPGIYAESLCVHVL